MRDIDGFPIGKDEDILALSDPSFYTACPNPYIKQFIEEYGTSYDPETDDYHREPFVGDVSEGKSDAIYRAYSYHTQVPHKAIQQYIKHYTNESDLVLDCFCGTGMTGVAAQETNRRGVLLDLSPYATFISSSCNNPNFDKKIIKEYIKIVINELHSECDWLYITQPTNNKSIYGTKQKGIIKYTVWTDFLICPYCNNDFSLWKASVEETPEKRIQMKTFSCPHCNAELSTRTLKKSTIKQFDSATGIESSVVKREAVLLFYTVGKKTFEKVPDAFDFDLLNNINEIEIPCWFPVNKMSEHDGAWGDTWRRGVHEGITHVHHFFIKRSLYVLSKYYDIVMKNIKPVVYRNLFINALLASIPRASIQNRYMPEYGNRHVGVLSGTLYIPHFCEENNIINALERRLKKMEKGTLSKKSVTIISCQSATNTNIPDNSIDYIFTDPPFGDNLMYSELNFTRESWMKIFTNNKDEAIISVTQNKQLEDYTNLMIAALKDYYRVLKPNRWITVEFHNSRASVWNGIQEALTRAGFIISQVSVLDKKKGTIKQLSCIGAVEKDLVINAYKPATDFSERFLKIAGEGMEFDFIAQQLEHLPIRPNIERTDKMLYSKMLAHYVENGFKIKYNSTNFYKSMSDNFTELDGYWFLDSQVKKYNEWKSGLSLDELREKLSGQQVLLITDEKSALTWLYYFLVKPHTYSDIYTGYQQVATTTDDAIPELKDLLENNFILEDGKYRRPLSESEKAEVEKNQEKELERGFNKLLKQAKEGKGKIKNVRREALVYGFTKCYQEGRYQDILTVANKLYASTLEASGEIMDFVDIARIKTAGEKEM